MERKQIFWEDVQTKEDIPSSYSLKLDMTRMVHAVSGTQDFYPLHHDRDFAKESGAPDIFVMSGFILACFSRLLTDWIGDEGWVCSVKLEFRKMNLLGDTITTKGKVINKYIQNGVHLVDTEVWMENMNFGISVTGKATVCLPSRAE